MSHIIIDNGIFGKTERHGFLSQRKRQRLQVVRVPEDGCFRCFLRAARNRSRMEMIRDVRYVKQERMAMEHVWLLPVWQRNQRVAAAGQRRDHCII